MRTKDDRKTYGHLVGTRATVIGTIFLAVMGLIALGIWHLDGVTALCGESQNQILLKRLTDCGGLSTLGDFLAGVFAPLAFIGLAATYLAQREQLRLAIQDSKLNREAQLKEAALNNASVQINYKLALYDKRKFVFDKVEKAGDAYMGAVTDDMLVDLKLALYDAQFVYPDEMQDWILKMLDNAVHLKMRMAYTDEAEPKRKRQSWSQQDEDHLNQAYEEVKQCQTILYNNLLETPLYERFKPYLRLPDEVVIEKVK